MEFFNKKQDVIDLQLTGYGKQLLSRGLFKPVYYAFSDDGVIYDDQWFSGSDGDAQQSGIETRIQEETPRLKTQYRKVGAEKAIFNTLNASSLYAAATSIFEVFELNQISEEDPSQLYELFQSLASNIGFAEAEKLLQSTLGTKSYQNSFDPAWNALFYNGEISGSTPHYQKNNIFVPKIPQLNCTLTDKVYRMNAKYNPYELLSKPKEVFEGLKQRQGVLMTGGETQAEDSDGVFFQRVIGTPNVSEEAAAGALLALVLGLITEEQLKEKLSESQPSLFIEKDFLFISLEEANVDFDRENFMIEVFEVDTVNNDGDGEEQLTKMFFQSESRIGFIGEQNSIISNTIKNRSVEEVFHFEVDDEINSRLGCYLIGTDKNLKKQSLYVDNVFDCTDVPQENRVSIDPYTSLPDVTTGEVC